MLDKINRVIAVYHMANNDKDPVLLLGQNILDALEHMIHYIPYKGQSIGYVPSKIIEDGKLVIFNVTFELYKEDPNYIWAK